MARAIHRVTADMLPTVAMAPRRPAAAVAGRVRWHKGSGKRPRMFVRLSGVSRLGCRFLESFRRERERDRGGLGKREGNKSLLGAVSRFSLAPVALLRYAAARLEEDQLWLLGRSRVVVWSFLRK